MNDERRVDALLREVSRRVSWQIVQQLMHGSGLELLCCVHRAARDAAEAVRILEGHRRKGALGSRKLVMLERYRRIYEVSELVLLEYSSHPENLTPAALESFYEAADELRFEGG